MANRPKVTPQHAAQAAATNLIEGVLEIEEKGAAFLRDPKKNYAVRPEDPIVPPEWIKKLGLRGGEFIAAEAAPGGRGPRGTRLTRITHVMNTPVETWSPPPDLADTTAIDPDRAIHFDTVGGPASMRVVEMFTPIGFGQRGLIVAPPRTGKTILLQQMAHGIASNHPDAYMIVLLIDERPEEVTDMRRNVRGEVIASSNDRDVSSHIRIARLVIEHARRLVENGRHIVILLDSITRLARAFNNAISGSGRTMSGGLDSRALIEPKQIFGAARNVEGGGSLTIIASALIDTGSRADDFIFQEFKGTGNMELVLNRELANQRIWPAIDLKQSGTRKEEKLLDPEALRKINLIRRQLYDVPPTRQMSLLLERLAPHDSLAAFLSSLKAV
ncbi:MAG: transcription termination factor Rho [Phycisphaerales bacterium]|nr:transcription termination factor Rho [Phycisphaerales bacterium]